MPQELWGFPIWLVKQAVSQAQWALRDYPLKALWLIVEPQVVSSHAHTDQYSAEYSGGDTCVDLWNFPSVQLSITLPCKP